MRVLIIKELGEFMDQGKQLVLVTLMAQNEEVLSRFY
jgi:hypothetical protein